MTKLEKNPKSRIPYRHLSETNSKWVCDTFVERTELHGLKNAYHTTTRNVPILSKHISATKKEQRFYLGSAFGAACLTAAAFLASQHFEIKANETTAAAMTNPTVIAAAQKESWENAKKNAAQSILSLTPNQQAPTADDIKKLSGQFMPAALKNQAEISDPLAFADKVFLLFSAGFAVISCVLLSRAGRMLVERRRLARYFQENTISHQKIIAAHNILVPERDRITPENNP